MLASIRKNVEWRAIPIAGLIGGSAFLLVIILLGQLVTQTDWTLYIRYFAGLVMGESVLVPRPEESTAVILIVGLLVHYVLSMLFALVIGIVVHRWGFWVGIIGGAILGLSLFYINLYTMTLIFPWFFALNSPVLAISHIIFGLVAGGVYEILDQYDMPITGETTP